MQPVIETLKAWQLHPFVDHFTVALILIGIITDLFGSLFSARMWIRYMALTLMIVGAIGAAGSNVTGGWEAGRVWDSVSGPGKTVLERHAQFGDILPWVFGALALWRLGIQFLGFIATSRPVYVVVAIAAGIAIVYQGHLGAVMVYDYGIGTALLSKQSTAPAAALHEPEVPNIPNAVSSLLPSPIPSAAPTIASSPAASTPMTPPTPGTATMPPGTPAPSSAPSIGANGAAASPLPAESPSPEAKNL
jgi:uncharacterized membrane protein